MSLVKGVLDVSCSIFNAVLHVILRDLTDYYWYTDETEKKIIPQEEDLLENVEINDNDIPVCLANGETEDETSTCENLNQSENFNRSENVNESENSNGSDNVNESGNLTKPEIKFNDEIANNHHDVTETTDNEKLNCLDSPQQENNTELENLDKFNDDDNNFTQMLENFEVTHNQCELHLNTVDVIEENVNGGNNETINYLEPPKQDNYIWAETDYVEKYNEEGVCKQTLENVDIVSRGHCGLYFKVGNVNEEIFYQFSPNTYNPQQNMEYVNEGYPEDLSQSLYDAQFEPKILSEENTDTFIMNAGDAYSQIESPIEEDISPDTCNAMKGEQEFNDETEEKLTSANTDDEISQEKEKPDEESECELCTKNFGQLSDGEGFEYLKLQKSPSEPSVDEKQKKPKIKAKSKISRYLGKTTKQQVKNVSLNAQNEMENTQSSNVVNNTKKIPQTNNQNESLQLPNTQIEQKLLMNINNVVENFEKLESFLESSQLNMQENTDDTESGCSGESWIGRFLSDARAAATKDHARPNTPVQNESSSFIQTEENDANLCDCTNSHCCLLDMCSDAEDLNADFLTPDELKSVETGSVSDWLYQYRVNKPTSSRGKLDTCSDQELNSDERMNLQPATSDEDFLVKKLFIKQWLDNTETYQHENLCNPFDGSGDVQ